MGVCRYAQAMHETKDFNTSFPILNIDRTFNIRTTIVFSTTDKLEWP